MNYDFKERRASLMDHIKLLKVDDEPVIQPLSSVRNRSDLNSITSQNKHIEEEESDDDDDEDEEDEYE